MVIYGGLILRETDDDDNNNNVIKFLISRPKHGRLFDDEKQQTNKQKQQYKQKTADAFAVQGR